MRVILEEGGPLTDHHVPHPNHGAGGAEEPRRPGSQLASAWPAH